MDCPLLNHFLASYQKNYTPNLESIVASTDQPEESVHSPSASKSSFIHQEYLDPRPRKISLHRASKNLDQLFMVVEKKEEHKDRSEDRRKGKGELALKMNIKEILTKNSDSRNRSARLKTDNSKDKKQLQTLQVDDRSLFKEAPKQPLISFSQKTYEIGIRKASPPLIIKPATLKSKPNRYPNVEKIVQGLNNSKLKAMDPGMPVSASRYQQEAPKSVTGLFSKKPTPNLISARDPNRDSSRKSSLGKKKPSARSPADSTHRPQASVKIENKDFISKLMNINIIKIKPDLKNNPCICRTTASPNKSAKLSKDRRPSNPKKEEKQSVSLEKLLQTSKSTTRNRSAGHPPEHQALRKKGYNLIGLDSANSKKISKTASHMLKHSETHKQYTKDCSRVSSHDRSRAGQATLESSLTAPDPQLAAKPSSNQRLFSLIKNMHDSPLTDRQFRPLKRKPTVPVTHAGLKENIRKALEAKQRRKD